MKCNVQTQILARLGNRIFTIILNVAGLATLPADWRSRLNRRRRGHRRWWSLKLLLPPTPVVDRSCPKVVVSGPSPAETLVVVLETSSRFLVTNPRPFACVAAVFVVVVSLLNLPPIGSTHRVLQHLGLRPVLVILENCISLDLLDDRPTQVLYKLVRNLRILKNANTFTSFEATLFISIS